jgi:hypothetical protein
MTHLVMTYLVMTHLVMTGVGCDSEQTDALSNP